MDAHPARLVADVGSPAPVLLPPSRPRDRRLVLGVRPADLRRLHDRRAGRDPLPRARGRLRQARARRRQRAAVAARADAPDADDDGARHEDPDRPQRRRLPDHRRAGRRDQQPRRKALQPVGAVRPARTPRRLVAADHVRVPARGHRAHRVQHGRALVRRRPRRGVPRPAPLHHGLPRLRPRRVGRRALPVAARRHRRRVRRDLRDPRRAARDRVERHRAADGHRDDVDHPQPRDQLRDPRASRGAATSAA